MTAVPSEEYQTRLEALDSALHECIEVSHSCAGIRSPSSAHYFASLLFTSLCTRGVSLATLVPHSSWAKRRFEHWDFASASGVVRSILEVRLAFFYLCTEKVAEDEWNCRWNLFNLHDCCSRIELFLDLNSHDQVASFQTQASELRRRLEENRFFSSLLPKEQRRLLRGKTPYMESLESIAARIDVDLSTFRLLYRLFSNQVHGLPMSFYRMGEQNRGRGVHSESEGGYTCLCISFAVKLLVGARDEMRILFAGARGV